MGKDRSLALIKTLLTFNVSLIVFAIGARLKCTRKIAFLIALKVISPGRTDV